jgi:hypothetical protein
MKINGETDEVKIEDEKAEKEDVNKDHNEPVKVEKTANKVEPTKANDESPEKAEKVEPTSKAKVEPPEKAEKVEPTSKAKDEPEIDDDDDDLYIEHEVMGSAASTTMTSKKYEPASESDSDVLVIDIDDDDEEEAKKPAPKKEEEAAKNRPGKRKRKSTYKDEEPDDEKPAAKTSRRESTATTASKKFEQVENELEAMFAGVIQIESPTPPKPSTSSSSKSKKPAVPAIKDDIRSKGKNAAAKATTTASGKRSHHKKRNNDNNRKSSNNDKDRDKSAFQSKQEMLLDRFKGPFVRIEGDMASPRWANIVNHATDPLDKREPEPDLDQIARVTGFGYNLTTLSAKYEVRKVDESWICVFCRKASHYNGLGDLFGPYFIPAAKAKGLSLPSPVKATSKAADLASSFIIGGSDQAGAKAKKRQRKKSAESPSKNNSRAGQVEVWFHEDCICWMPQIRLVGCQLLGLPEAIKVSQKAVCTKCLYKGCTVACGRMKCREVAHYHCAEEANWTLIEDEFQARCESHSEI